MTKVLLINYYEDLKDIDLKRIINLIHSYNFKDVDFVNINSKGLNKNSDINCNLISLQEIEKFYSFGFQISKDSLSFSLNNTLIKKKFFITKVEIEGRLRIKDNLGKSMNLLNEETIFGKLSENIEKQFLYLPRSFFYKMHGQGPVNQIGFRQSFDSEEIKNRPKNCILICTFGGSTTWSIDCTFTETWSYLLQEFLNSNQKQKKKKNNLKS